MTDPLTEIGLHTGTDKATFHNYTRHYHYLFEEYRYKRLFFLELGLGGYEWPEAGGESARMWREYAPNWDIVSIDVHQKNARQLVPYDGFTFYQGSQDDGEFLGGILSKHGAPMIVLDDASHVSHLTIASFNILWPSLAPGGWYIIEDIGTSYPYHGNYHAGEPSAVTVLGKHMIDSLNAHSPHGRDNDILPGTTNFNLDALYFFPNGVALRKQDDN